MNSECGYTVAPNTTCSNRAAAVSIRAWCCSQHLDIVRDANSTKYFQRAVKAGYRTVAMDAQGTTVLGDIPDDDSRPLMLIMGGEDKRIGQFILNEAEIVARIPQQGQVNSLNASVAAGIALYHFFSLEKAHGQD
jgi:23S rRNA (guanosine2251-2'-O)-methyltransferase